MANMPSSNIYSGAQYVGPPQPTAQGYQAQTRGYQDLLGQNFKTSGLQAVQQTPQASATYGMVPQETMDAYYNQAGDYAQKQAKGAIASQFGESGYGALGNGAQAWQNTDAAQKIGIAKAGANVQNAQQGVQAQSQFNQANLNRQGQIGENYFSALNNPLEAYYRMMLGAGGSGGAQVHQPTTGGTSGGGAQSTPWWQTSYQTMPAMTDPAQAAKRESDQPSLPGYNPINPATPYQYYPQQQQPVNPYANIYPGVPQEPSNNMNYGYGGLV
jgi:hypothetical protein